jgi:phosphomannomutase/phosphoglucomutase
LLKNKIGIKLNTHIFREYDIRGIVSTDLTEETVTNIGKAFATRLLRNGGKVASIGGDVRSSTNILKSYLIAGITSTGVDVMDLGDCPTGAQYYSHFTRPVDGGIMITGSHNPPEYNGFKMTQFKKNLYGTVIQDLKNLILDEDFETGSGNVTLAPILDEYITYSRSKFNVGNKTKVVIDHGNGASALCGVDVFKNIENLDIIHLFETPDGTFPNHHPDPTVEANLIDLRKAVAKHNADFGIGFDGDADRIGVINSSGDIIWGDKLLIIYAMDALSRVKQEIIFDVKCSEALIEEITKAGGTPVMSATGHSLLKAKMQETGAKVAGEMSGHMFFADDNYGYDDAIYAAIRLINIVSQSGQKIEDFLKGITNYYSTPEIRLEAKDDETKFEITKQAVAYFTKNYTCNTIDGVRIQFNDGWGLIRSSNTQPVLVTRMEATSQKRLEEIKSLIISKLAEFGELKEGGH